MKSRHTVVREPAAPRAQSMPAGPGSFDSCTEDPSVAEPPPMDAVVATTELADGAGVPDASSRTVSYTATRDFRLFWLGATVSAIGDDFSKVALPLLILKAGGSIAGVTEVT